MTFSHDEMEALVLIKQMFFRAATPVPIFLNFIADRLVNVHGENELLDYIHALRDKSKQLERIAELLGEDRKS